jgi:hypothetical protein
MRWFIVIGKLIIKQQQPIIIVIEQRIVKQRIVKQRIEQQFITIIVKCIDIGIQQQRIQQFGIVIVIEQQRIVIIVIGEQQFQRKCIEQQFFQQPIDIVFR